MLAFGSPQKNLVDSITPLIHSDRLFDAAKVVSQWVHSITGKCPPTDSKKQCYETINILLHWCLNNNGMEEAAQILWPPTMFSPLPESTQRVWRAFDTQNFILLMGAGSMGKSYSMGVRLFLEWIRDPEFTNVKVVGPSQQHLQDNLFTHLVTLHRGASIPLPGVINELFIGTNAKSRKGSISGVIVPLGRKSAGRLQGTHRVQRKKAHPVFGSLTRLFVFLDEIANIPKGIWRDIDNLLSAAQGDGGLKIAGAYNPTDQNDDVGTRCEPTFGWGSFDMDEHYEWMSKRGWFVVRLDAAKCENVLQNRVVFPGLQTRMGYDAIIQNSGGTNSPNYYSMARGCFPPAGMVMSIMPQGLLAQFKADVIWYETPIGVAGVDIALEGNDSAVFAKGLYGLATGIKLQATLQEPNGIQVIFKNKKGQVVARPMILLEQIFRMPKGDTVALKNEIVKLCRQTGVAPDWLAVDRTGNGQGVYDLLRYEWHVGVIGVNFYEGASETRIMAEDGGTAKELYDRAQTELLFAVRKFIEFGYLRCAPGLETSELYANLTGRLYRPTGNKCKAETKSDFKSRNQGKSPDEGDAVSLLVHAVRRASGLVPGMDSQNSESKGDDEDDWDSGARCDLTNRFEYL